MPGQALASDRLQSTTAYCLLFVILFFAPLIRGGNRPLAQLLLEILALVLLVFICRHARSFITLPGAMLAGLSIILLLPLIQLIPLPFSIWRHLPGREPYADGLMQIDETLSDAFLSISVVPFQTQSAWLALLPVIAVFLASFNLPTARLRVLVTGWFVLVIFQAALAIVQTGDFFEALTGVRVSGNRSQNESLI